MKRLLAFILLLSSLSAWCFFPTLGAFAMISIDSNMNHDMWDDMVIPCHWNNDSVSINGCCESPFLNSITYTGSSYIPTPDDFDDKDLKVLCVLYERLLINNIHRLNSPPSIYEYKYITHKNIYISLVGIIKNNA